MNALSHTLGIELTALDPTPLYNRIKRALRARILDGTYPPHARMPSESELGVLFKASRITVRQALGDLQKEGLIFRVHGKGTFVSSPKAFQNVTQLQGFAEAMSALGHEILNHLRSFRFVAATREIAARLQLRECDPVCEIKRVRLLNREPVSLEITYLTEALGRRLERADLITRDIFLIIENDCATLLGHATLSVDAILADDELVRALKLEEGAPVLHIERLTHDDAGRPIDFEHLYFRGDAFQYRFQVERRRGATV